MLKKIAHPLSLALIGATCLALSAPSLAKPVKKHAAPAKEAPAEPLTEDQLASAERVLTGEQQCEFNQKVDLEKASDKPGYFQLSFKGKKYSLVPEPTTTGAVRLEDKKAGVVWLQIPNKSMLMNAKIGQRMVDDCVHPSQKV